MPATLDIAVEIDRAPARSRCKERGPVNTGFKYVRRVKGGKWQARPCWTSQIRENLGLFPSAAAAKMAISRYIHTGERPAHLLPCWVRRAGRGYIALIRAPGAKARLGPFRTPHGAHRAAVEHLRRKLGRRAEQYLIGRESLRAL